MASRIERPGARPAHRAPDARIKMRTGHPARRNGSVADASVPVVSSLGSTWVCGPSGLLPDAGGYRLIDFDTAELADEHAMRIGRKRSLPSRDCRVRTRRGRHARAIALAVSRSSIRTQNCLWRRDRDRTGRMLRSLAAQGLSAPSSVSTVRRLIAQSASGRQRRDPLVPA